MSLNIKIRNPSGRPLNDIDGCFLPYKSFDHPDTNEVLYIINYQLLDRMKLEPLLLKKLNLVLTISFKSDEPILSNDCYILITNHKF